jgi:hypothetical protein
MAQAPYPRNYFEALCETMEFLRTARGDESLGKDDVLDSMENRVSFLLTKLLATPTTTSFSLFHASG